MTWVGVGTAVVGTGVSAYGANKAKQAAGKGAEAEWLAMISDTAFQRKLWEEEQDRLAPRHETALELGLPMMEQYRTEGGIGLRGDRPEYSTVANPDYDPEQAAAYQDYLFSQQNPAQAEINRKELLGGEGAPVGTRGKYTGDTTGWKEALHEPYTPYTTPETIQRKNMYLEDMPLYQMQMDQGQQAMADAGIGDYGQRRFQENLGVAEQDASYARLQDMMQIGLGAAGSAGAGAQRFGTNAANSMMGAGNAIAQGQMQQGNIQNSMYQNLAGTMGQLPAYYASQQQRPTNIQGPVSPYQMAQGGIR